MKNLKTDRTKTNMCVAIFKSHRTVFQIIHWKNKIYNIVYITIDDIIFHFTRATDQLIFAAYCQAIN